MHTREENLRRLARDRLATGELPPVRPGPTLERVGSGRPCALCGAAVRFEEVECQWPGDLDTRRFRFHLACHKGWVCASVS